jgi:hypothetical protein
MTINIIVHTGHLSVDNLAVFPLTTFANIGKAANAPRLYGNYYGEDKLVVSDEDLPSVESLLTESNMLYMVEGRHTHWQNVKTDRVRAVLARMKASA